MVGDMTVEIPLLHRLLAGRQNRRQRRKQVAALVAAGDRANSARDWQKAGTSYEAALGIDPALGAIWVQYGHALKEQGFLSKALHAYRQALALDDASADTYLQVGHVLKLQGHLDLAQSAYRNAYLRDPASPHGKAELLGIGADLPAQEVVDAFQGSSMSRQGDGSGMSRLDSARHGNNVTHVEDQGFIHDVHGSGNAGSGARYVSVEHLLERHGLGSAFLAVFNPDFYYYANSGVRDGFAPPSRAKCLVHFCESGIDSLLTIAEHAGFEPEFYCSAYLGGMPFTPGNAYRHWLTLGVAKEWAPNRNAWAKQLVGRDLTGLDGMDVPLFMAMHDQKTVGQNWTTQFELFVNGAVADAHAELAVNAETADALVAIADRLAVTGREAEAFALYQRILLHVPEHRPAMTHQADALLRRGALLEARDLYMRLVEAADAPRIWSYINLAVCHEQLGQRLEALRVLDVATRAIPGDQGLRRRFGDLARRYLAHEWDAGIAQGRLGRFEQAQAGLKRACMTVAGMVRTEPPAASRPVQRIAILANLDLAQCRFYRVDQKVEQLRAAGYDVVVHDMHAGIPDFLAALHLHEAAIFYRVPARYDVIVAIEKARELGVTTFYEIDDLIFDAAEYPASLASYGGQVDELEYAGLKLGVPLFASAMALCDYGIASTPALAEQMRGQVRTGTVFVHRNAFGRRHEAWAASKPHEHQAGRVTLFYGSGTKAHKEDFQELIEPALVELVRRHGDRISIVLMGFVIVTERLRQIEANLAVVAPNWDVDSYWAMLSMVDINIAVLKPSLMADCKSEIKWLEAAMFAIPSVVSDTATYLDAVEAGVTGLVCSTPGEWTAALDRFVADAALRQRIGDAARDRIRRDYGLDAMAGSLRRIFDQVTPTREPLPTILIVNVFYPPQAIGGATRVVHDNVRHLAAHHGDRFNVEVFTSIEGGLAPYQVQSYVMDGVRVTGITTPDDPDIERRIKDERIGTVFGQVLDHLRPVMVHFHCIQRLTPSIVLTTLERAIPYVITAHDGWWISDEQFLLSASGAMKLYDHQNPLATLQKHGQVSFDRLMALRQPLSGAAKVLAVSEPFADLYRSCGVANVVTVANGVSALPQPVRSPAPDGRVRLGFIGGLAAHKGYDLIKYALYGNSFGNLRLLAIDHAMRPGTSRREMWGGTEVEFQPKRPQGRVVQLYGEIDVLLAPSVWPESYGLVSREALCAGCWVIASDKGSIGEYVLEDQNGFIVDVAEPDHLAETLGKINRDPLRYLVSPAVIPEMREASSQGDELAALYSGMLDGKHALQ